MDIFASINSLNLDYMKTYCLCLFVLFILLPACSKNDDTEWKNQENAKNDQYLLEDIHFYIAEGDGVIDTVRCQLDTIRYVNANNLPAPNQTFYPYEAIEDSFKIEVVEQYPLYDQPIVFTDPIVSPSMVRDKDIYFSANDPVILQEMPGITTRTCSCAKTSISTTVSPRVIITVTGTYYRIRSKVSFAATYRGRNTQNKISVKGYWYNSTVTSESLNGSAGIKTIVTEIK